MGKRFTLLFIAVVSVSGLMLAPAAAGPPAAGPTSYGAPFVSTQDWSNCDDGAGTAVCSASATLSTTGNVATEASLRPAHVAAFGGFAEGRGGPQIAHRLSGAYAAVRYSFFFGDVTAAAHKEPVAVQDIGPRAFAIGYVHHTKCPRCAVQQATLVADADAFSSEPANAALASLRVDVEMRNPAGKVPKGLTIATGYLLSDIRLYEDVPAFTSSAEVRISGRLVRVEVGPVL